MVGILGLVAMGKCSLNEARAACTGDKSVGRWLDPICARSDRTVSSLIGVLVFDFVAAARTLGLVSDLGCNLLEVLFCRLAFGVVMGAMGRVKRKDQAMTAEAR
jgi:hypothetical protein